MSQGTPKCWAAKARACAWLPALPAVTPLAAPAPSEASLFIAPRILKAPVRCRLSALSTTSPPRRWDSVTEDTIGVSLTTPAATTRAARMSASVTMPAGRYCRAHPRVSSTPSAHEALGSNETLGCAGLGTLVGVRAVLIGNATSSDSGFVGDHLRGRGFTFTEGQREHPRDWPAID